MFASLGNIGNGIMPAYMVARKLYGFVPPLVFCSFVFIWYWGRETRDELL